MTDLEYIRYALQKPYTPESDYMAMAKVLLQELDAKQNEVDLLRNQVESMNMLFLP